MPINRLTGDEFLRLVRWFRDPGRKPASLAFAAGAARDAATAAEDSRVLDRLRSAERVIEEAHAAMQRYVIQMRDGTGGPDVEPIGLVDMHNLVKARDAAEDWLAAKRDATTAAATPFAVGDKVRKPSLPHHVGTVTQVEGEACWVRWPPFLGTGFEHVKDEVRVAIGQLERADGGGEKR